MFRNISTILRPRNLMAPHRLPQLRNLSIIFRPRNPITPHRLPQLRNISTILRPRNLMTPHRLPQRLPQNKPFHTTVKSNINPLVGIGARLAARVIGRRAKKKWDTMPLEERKKLKRLIKGDDGIKKMHVVFGGVVLSSLAWYLSHFETSFTGRTRYISMSREDMAEIGRSQAKEIAAELKQDNLLYDPKGPTYKQIHKIVNNLIEGLEYIPDLKQHVEEHGKNIQWKLYVVSSKTPSLPEGQQNAFVLPSGKIFVYDGILKMCENDAALAAVLAHEMAHAILDHSREKMSANGPTTILKIFLTAGVWFLGMDMWASLVVEQCNDYIISVLSELPYSRLMETEADMVGIEIAAAACYDSRNAVKFWDRHADVHEHKTVYTSSRGPLYTKFDKMNFFSTHPLSSDRSENISNRIEEMDLLSEDCGCVQRKEEWLLTMGFDLDNKKAKYAR